MWTVTSRARYNGGDGQYRIHGYHANLECTHVFCSMVLFEVADICLRHLPVPFWESGRTKKLTIVLLVGGVRNIRFCLITSCIVCPVLEHCRRLPISPAASGNSS